MQSQCGLIQTHIGRVLFSLIVFITASVTLHQVESIVDASQSYYSQLQKVKGTENENVNVSATQHNVSVGAKWRDPLSVHSVTTKFCGYFENDVWCC